MSALEHPLWCASSHCSAGLRTGGVHERTPIPIRLRRGAPRLLLTLWASRDLRTVRVRLVDVGNPVHTTDLSLDEADLLAAWLVRITAEAPGH